MSEIVNELVNIYNSRESGNPVSFSSRTKNKEKTLDPRSGLGMTDWRDAPIFISWCAGRTPA